MAKCDYKISEKEFFINPYNFVPVNLRKTERSDITKVKEKLHTGYLRCQIKCKTHLAIPDTDKKIPEMVKVNKQWKEHDCYPFMKMGDGTPFIPGSTVRGVVRNIYETITDSCFGTMKTDTIITARSKDAFRPGLLIRNEKNDWELYRAQKHLVVIDERFFKTQYLDEKEVGLYDEKSLLKQNGDFVKFVLAKKNGKDWPYISRGRNLGIYVKNFSQVKHMEGEKNTGYLCIGEKAPKRHFHGIFQKMELENGYGSVKNEDFQKLESVITEYRNASVNRNYLSTHSGYGDYEKMKQNGVIPVYYMLQDKALYASFAALGRKAFCKTLNETVQEKSHQKCTGRDCLCPACALFGTVEGDALGSRVRFTDAKCIENKGFEKDKIVFAELSSPRISYLPFYLKEQQYNSKVQNQSKASYEKGYDSKTLEIRGRKFYWHHEPDLSQSNNIPKNDRNASFEVMKPKSEFEFCIYFDGITEQQLELLAAAVHLNENANDGKLCQKIGHGKPLGYGSVKMTVTACTERKFDLENGWIEEKMDIPCHRKWDAPYYEDKKETIESLKEICCYDAKEKWGDTKVAYPSISSTGVSNISGLKENDLASHKWFTNNFKVGANSPKQPLPEILADDLKMAKYEIIVQQETSTKPDMKQGKVFAAKVVSCRGQAKNANYLEYTIEILNDEYYKNKKCTMTARNTEKIRNNQIVNVTMYKNYVFNLVNRK